MHIYKESFSLSHTQKTENYIILTWV